MAKKPQKVAVIGLDCALPDSILRWVEAGALPNLKQLIDKGAFCDNALVPYPTITPPNWTTIATGAWPGTHGITDFHVFEPGKSIHMSSTHQGFNRDDCLVENIWEAADKEGKKCIVFNYPSSWGTKLKNGIVIGGNSNILTDYRPPEMIGTEGKFGVASDQIYSLIMLPRGGQKVEFEEVDDDDWANLPETKGAEPQEAEVPMMWSDSLYEMAETTWYFLAIDSEGKGYDKVALSPSRDFNEAFCVVGVGQWSPKIVTTVKTKDGEEKTINFRAKLLEMAGDLTEFKFYHTGLGEQGGWVDSPEIAQEICDASPEGTFATRGGGLTAYRKGWIDIDTYVEAQDFQNVFFGDAVSHLLTKKEWDIFYMHAHATDWMYHGFMNEMDPNVTKDEAVNKMAMDAERRMYESVDRMVGQIVEAAGKDTLIVIVSDHGAVADGAPMPLLQPLVEKGLVKIVGDKGVDTYGFGPLYSAELDWSQTKCLPQRAVHIFVNLKGRDPEGCVEPEDYEDVRQEIIDALLTYVDPKSGKRPFAMALRREDARPFGMYGERAGDVIYAIYPWFGGQHGNILPTAKWGVGTLHSTVIFSGPGIKKGARLDRTVWITDVVPTICYLLDLPLPEAAEGAVIYQAFKDPNFKMKEIEKLKAGLERMEVALQRSEREPWDKHDCA